MLKRHLDNTFLSTQQAAELCGVHRRTILTWAKEGAIPAHRTVGGWFRIHKEDLLQFMKQQGVPIPETKKEEFDFKKARIVIIDDDRKFVRSLKAMLELEIPTVAIEVAYDGFSGGMVVSTFRPHIILLDYKMPGIDGLEVCRSIRSNLEIHSVGIIIVSGHLTPATAKELQAAGANQLFEKPPDRKALLAGLEGFIPREMASKG